MAILTIGFDKTFTTIMEAYALASAGDTLLIDEGSYVEAIALMDGKYVNLVGNTNSPGESKVIIVAPIDEQTLYIAVDVECTIFIENITFNHIFSGESEYSNTLGSIQPACPCTIVFNRCYLDAGYEQFFLFYAFEDTLAPIIFNNCKLIFQEAVIYDTRGPYHFVWAGRDSFLYFNKCILSAQVEWLARCATPLSSDYIINKESIGYGPNFGESQVMPTKYYFEGLISDVISANSKVPGATFSLTDRAPEIALTPDKLRATLSTEHNNHQYLIRADTGKTSGKWYWEVKMFSASRLSRCGVATENAGKFVGLGSDVHGWGFAAVIDAKNYMFSGFITGDIYYRKILHLANANNNDTVGIALDLDNGMLWYSLGGEWLFDGDPSIGQNPVFEGVAGKIFPATSLYSSYAVSACTEFIFDPSNLVYDIPEGFSFYSTEMSWKVKCINAVTNEVEGYAMSDPVTKEYYLETTYSGEHFVICEDAVEMPDFNNVLLGRLIPKELK